MIILLAGRDKNLEARGMIKPLTKICNKEIIKWLSESCPFSIKLMKAIDKFNSQK